MDNHGRTRGRRDSTESLTVSMDDGGSGAARNRNRNRNGKPTWGIYKDRLNISMDGGVKGSSVAKSTASSASASAGSSSLKTKLAERLRFSKLNLTDRGGHSKAVSKNGGEGAQRASQRQPPSSSSSSKKDLLERAYKNGCSLDAGLGSKGALQQYKAAQEEAVRAIVPSAHPSSNPGEVAFVGRRKSLDVAMLDLHGLEMAEKEPLDRIWEAKRRSTTAEVRSVHVETDEAAETVAEEVNARVKAADMPSRMQVHAFRCARRECDAQLSFSSKKMAFALKKEFDRAYGPAWHCIVGTSFGSFVTHSVGGFLYFSIDRIAVLLFKTAVERLD
uniref:TSA: Wollemia nobilis Ref_Wollemi_Transcript_11130_1719 transcribed RNA sequence n=1 Tax=Wollemia nobilis TaxID=56998 RepID=A0A0C9RVD2_9CONI